MRRCLVSAAAAACPATAGAPTVTIAAKPEGKADWNAAPLECAPGAGAIYVEWATYGEPCQAGCAKCSGVEQGNLNQDALAWCDGKQSCVVSSCPCTAGNIPPAGGKCDEHWKDPAPTCPKGLTVIYRCGASTWGMYVLGVLCVVGGGYVGGGVGLGVTTTGAKAELAAHPHYRRWLELHGLVNDGVALARRGGGGGPGDLNRAVVAGGGGTQQSGGHKVEKTRARAANLKESGGRQRSEGKREKPEKKTEKSKAKKSGKSSSKAGVRFSSTLALFGSV